VTRVEPDLLDTKAVEIQLMDPDACSMPGAPRKCRLEHGSGRVERPRCGPRQTPEFIVQSIAGREIAKIDANPTSTIMDVKRHMHAIKGISVEEQNLYRWHPMDYW